MNVVIKLHKKFITYFLRFKCLYYTPILFANDTSIIVKSSKLKDFQNNMALAFNCVNKWFKVNLLSINVDKTHYLQFKTKNDPICNINIVCNDRLVTAPT